jgi:hypothetical protein
MGADHDDAGHDRNSWVLWLENEAALMACCSWTMRTGTSVPVFFNIKFYDTDTGPQ